MTFLDIVTLSETANFTVMKTCPTLRWKFRHWNVARSRDLQWRNLLHTPWPRLCFTLSTVYKQTNVKNNNKGGKVGCYSRTRNLISFPHNVMIETAFLLCCVRRTMWFNWNNFFSLKYESTLNCILISFCYDIIYNCNLTNEYKFVYIVVIVP